MQLHTIIDPAGRKNLGLEPLISFHLVNFLFSPHTADLWLLMLYPYPPFTYQRDLCVCVCVCVFLQKKNLTLFLNG
jgi:hypothetical protein